MADEIETDPALVRPPACAPVFCAGPTCRSSRSCRMGPIMNILTGSVITSPSGLPRIAWATGQAGEGGRGGYRSSRHNLPLAVPVQLAMGPTGRGLSLRLVHLRVAARGRTPTVRSATLNQAAADLAAFRERPAPNRRDRCAPCVPPIAGGGPLTEGERAGSASRSHSSATGSTAMLPSTHGRSHSTPPPWDGKEVWVHGDLLPGKPARRRGSPLGSPSTSAASTLAIPAWRPAGPHGTYSQLTVVCGFRAELQADDASWPAWPRLGALPGCISTAVLLGH